MNGLLALLLQQDLLNVWKDPPGGNRDAAEQLVQLLVIADGQLCQKAGDKTLVDWSSEGSVIVVTVGREIYREVTRGDALLLVVSGSVAGQLQEFGRKVFEDGSKVHAGALTDACGKASLLDQPGSAGNWERQPGLF